LASRKWQNRLVLGILVVGLFPIMVSIFYWFAGQPANNMLHGYPRLIGGYTNLHTHGLVMAFLTALGVGWSFNPNGQRWLGVLGAVLAALVLYFTYIRVGLIFVGVVTLGMIGFRTRRAVFAGVMIAGTIAFFLNPVFRDRFSDIWAILTFSPPDWGWDSIGSFRGELWRESFSAFRAQGPPTVMFGAGMEGYRTFYHHDPHNVYLLIWYHLGIYGLLIYLWIQFSVLQAAWRKLRSHVAWDRWVGQLVLLIMVAYVLCNALSDTFVARTTFSWLVWALAGLVFVREGKP
ncbi:MAG: O-antigen ligase family protein, partial [Proteobacteria bacterium]|nr:O-antigen ligase family protein [Pseudomonadota bacterium]